jgi:hypothetical protein
MRIETQVLKNKVIKTQGPRTYFNLFLFDTGKRITWE